MHDHRGFALLEVLIAAALLVALAAGTARIVAATVREAQASRLRAMAHVSAAGKIEELRSLPFGGAASGDDYVDAAGASLGGGPSPPGGAVFVRRWVVQPVDGDGEVVSLQADVYTRDGARLAQLVTVRAAR